jgi:cytochrome c oxidase assembly protein subunit 16
VEGKNAFEKVYAVARDRKLKWGLASSNLSSANKPCPQPSYVHDICKSKLSMAVFPNKKFRSAAEANTIASRYRSSLARHPFLLFGLPFIVTMVAGSFFLTPATAIRYEKHDRRVRRMSKEEELGIGKAGRRVDMKEEYYVSGKVYR